MSTRAELIVAMLLLGVAVVWLLQQQATRTTVTGNASGTIDPNGAGSGNP